MRFLEILDPKALETKLDQIIIQGEKLHVNRPLFDKQHFLAKVHHIETRHLKLSTGWCLGGFLRKP